MTAVYDRHIALSGGCNFRDLGGLPARDGGTVRWRRLYRSGVLDRLSDEDCMRIAGLGITAIVDLRTSSERQLRPSRSIAGATTWERDYGSSNADHNRPLDHHAPEKLRRMMLSVYAGLLDEQAEGYRALLDRLATTSGAVLFHCTGGKDRTGVGAALVLDLVGVDRAAIIEDYALTNQCLQRDAAVIDAAGQRHPREMRIADPAYLEAMFERLDREFGGAAGYATHLGLERDIAGRISASLLE